MNIPVIIYGQRARHPAIRDSEITGFHPHTGEFVGVGDRQSYEGAYPRGPRIRALLEEKDRLHKRQDEISKQLYGCALVAEGTRDAELAESLLTKQLERIAIIVKDWT